ncbi:MAG: DRTGG domain-containing protein [bacterium]|nr:DRTGG domain-containing protein [bacterium]
MLLSDLVQKLELRVLAGSSALDREVVGGYVSDMLSDVLASASAECVWVTRQSHQNVIAVAALLGISAVILVNCPLPDQVVIEKAESENLPLLYSKTTAFEMVGDLHELGIKGCRRA